MGRGADYQREDKSALERRVGGKEAALRNGDQDQVEIGQQRDEMDVAEGDHLPAARGGGDVCRACVASGEASCEAGGTWEVAKRAVDSLGRGGGDDGCWGGEVR